MECKRTLEDSAGRTELIKNALVVIFGIAVITTVSGLGSLICGTLTLALSVDHYYWPFMIGSGLWCGLPAFIQGIFGFLVWKNFNSSFPNATAKTVSMFYVMGIIGMSVAPQHLTYSIMALTACTGMANDKSGDFKCNPEYHDQLIVIQAFNIAFAALYELTSLTTLVYMLTKRRLSLLTGNPYPPCVCCANYATYNNA